MSNRLIRALVAAAVAVAASTVVATVPRALAASPAATTTTTATPPCVTAVAPIAILNTPATLKKLAAGVAQTVAIPSSVPATSSAVVVQVRTNGSKAGDLSIGPSGMPPVLVAHVLAAHWLSASAVVDAPGAQLSVLYSAIKGATANATITVTGYVNTPGCYNALPQAAAVDTTSGAGLTAAGALASGSSTPVNLNVGGTVPAKSGARVVTIHAVAGAAATTVTLSDDSTPANELVSWTIPANESTTDVRILPPSPTGNYVIGVSGSATNVSITPVGWFTDATAYAMSNDLLLDTTLGVGAKKAALLAGQKVVLTIPADIKSPAGLSLTLTEKATADAAVYVWPSSAAKPALMTANWHGARTGYAQILLPPGTAGTITIQVASGSINLQAVASGWIPVPPPANEPVPGVVTVPDPTQVSSVAPDPTTGNETLTYNGPDALNVGDVVVMDATADQPDGYLGIVTDTTTTIAPAVAPRSGLSPAGVTPSDTTGSQTVNLQPGALTDAIPTVDMDSGNLPTQSDDPAPDDSPALPPDTFSPTSSAQASALSPNATSSGALPHSAAFSCSAGVSASITASLKLTAGLDISGSWSPWHGVSANFSATGSLAGSVALNVNAQATCGFSRTLDGPSLPTIRFFIGPVPVVVRPKLSMDVSASGTIDGAFKASAGMTESVTAGVSYSNGNFTPYINSSSRFPVSVEARAGGDLTAEVKPRLDLTLYGIAGPFVEVGASAEGKVNLGANPWWTAQAAIVGDVGFAIDAFGIHKSYTAPEHTFASFNAGSAPGAYPGATITTTSLPAATIGQSYGAQLGATGGSPPYTWAVMSGGLPAGLSLSSSGLISGTPSTQQTANFTVRAIDSAGNRTGADQPLSITVNPPPPPPPSGGGGGGASVSVSWGARASASICGGDTSCTYVTISWSGFGTGNHTITPYFDGQGNWCGSACANSLVRSGASGTLTGYWAAGYCSQSHSVSATVDGVPSNSISTTQHGC